MATTEQWADARIRYETTGISGAKIAADIGVSRAALSKHATKNGWVKHSAVDKVDIPVDKVVDVDKKKVDTVDVVDKAKPRNDSVNDSPNDKPPTRRLTATGKLAHPRTIVAGVGSGGNQNGVSYSPELAEVILQRLRDGEGLNTICQDEGMPNASTVLGWRNSDTDGFAMRYADARGIGYERLSEEILMISDAAPPVLDNGATDSGAVQDKRLRVDTRKWLLSKVLPKIYGDNKHVEVSGTIHQTSDRTALEQELKALMSKGQQRTIDVSDAQVKDVTKRIE